MIAWLCWSAAWAVPEDALAPTLRALLADGRALEEQAPAEAARRYRAVYAMEPTYTQALRDLGRALVAAGDPDAAIAAWREAPYDADVAEDLATLLDSRGEHDEAAALWLRLQTLRSEAPAPFILHEALSRASIDLSTAWGPLDAWAASPDAIWDPRALAIIELGRTADDPALRAALLARLDAWEARFPEAATDAAVIQARRALSIDDLAARLASASPEPLTGPSVARLHAARASLASGDAAGATRVLRTLADAAPRSPEVRLSLGDALVAKDPDAAEAAWQRAVDLAPLDPQPLVRLGDLIHRRSGGARTAEALFLWRRAARLAPGRADLWVRIAEGELHQASEAQVHAAAIAWRRAAELDPKRRSDALSRAEDLLRPPPPEADPAADPSDRPPLSEAERAFWRAQAWALSGEPAEAQREARLAMSLAPEDPRVFALAAKVALAQGDRTAARAHLETSLTLRPGQADLLLLLADLDGGEAALRAAADAGSGEAWLRIAHRAWADGRVTDAQAALAGFDASPDLDRIEEAHQLAAEIDQTLARWAFGGLAAASVLVGAPLATRAWRRAGVGVGGFLARSPRSTADVARLTAVVRHDVLKHHLRVLDAVADALDAQDTEPGRWFADRLADETGPIARFRGVFDELDALARAAGVRLNLRHRDPVWGPIIAAIDELEAAIPALRAGTSRRLAGDLRRWSLALNATGQRALSRSVRDLSLVSLDAPRLSRVWADVAQEPAWRGVPPPAFEVVVQERVQARLYPSELVDIVGNLLRNAWQAILDSGGGRLGIVVDVEEDPLTGIERACIRVCDDAPKRLSTSMIRSRYIERGLGIAVDTAARAGGSVSVEPQAGYAKAVVVRLPRVESPEEAE